MRHFVFVVAISTVIGFLAGMASAESPAVPSGQQVTTGAAQQYCYYYDWCTRAYYYYQQPAPAAPAAPQTYTSYYSGPSQPSNPQAQSYSRGGGWYPFYGNRSSIDYLNP
ncbi:MAG: hypothetical protein ACLQNE_31665 [Thermoguttaceae bacterium]